MKMRFRNKAEGRIEILKFVKDSVKKGIFPTFNDLEKEFHIDLRSYFEGGVKEVYEKVGFNYGQIKKIQRTIKGYLITKKKLRFSVKEGKRKIAKYIRQEEKKGHFPGKGEVQEKFHIWFNSYFQSIQEVYKFANVNFKKIDPNPFIAIEKDKKLRKVSKILLKRMGFILIRDNRKNGADLLVKDRKGQIIPVELKAYHRNSNLPISNIFGNYENEMEQLQNYIELQKAPYGILITTTNRVRLSTPNNIVLIKGKDLIDDLRKFDLSEFITDINWIRNTYLSFDKTINQNIRKKKIINYIRKKVSKGHYPSMREIQNKFKINVRTYFPGNMFEAYKTSNVELPCRFLPKDRVKERVACFIREKLESGKYPSLEEIQNKFQIHLVNYFRSSRDMYRFARVPVPFRHLSKNQSKKIILRELKQESLKGKMLTWRRISKKFRISIPSYFKGMNEIRVLLANS